MTKGLAGSDSAVRERFEALGQSQIFRFFDRLSEAERRSLIEQAESIDLDLVARLVREALAPPPPPARIEPLAAYDAAHPDAKAAADAGRELLAAGRIAFYMVAGGQGTRLGYDGPKGEYPVGPFSGKTLFEWQAEKLLAAARRYGRPVPWVILVSEATEEATRRAFRDAGWFGLAEADVRFVRQRMLPAVDEAGRILLAAPDRIMLSPNGHGGSIEALGRGGTLDWLRERGVTHVSYFQVDNPIVDPADPAFLGFLPLTGAEMSAKAVEKTEPAERAGILATVNGRVGVVEYTELPDELANLRRPDGRLVYDLASIAAHGFSVEFLARMQDVGLPFHTAVKEVPTVDEEGRPKKVRGRKFETFVFDALALAEKAFAYLAERAEEFAPLKNREGADSPETVRRALLERTRRWHERAGLPPPERDEELELSPLEAADFDDFRARRAGRG